jgi:hypothetical protein
MSAVDWFIAKYGWDPTDLILCDHLSNEASGPEDEGTESKAAWKMQMARKLGMAARDQEVLMRLKIWVRIRPEWQSEKVCLTSIFFEQLVNTYQSSRGYSKSCGCYSGKGCQAKHKTPTHFVLTVTRVLVILQELRHTTLELMKHGMKLTKIVRTQTFKY